MPKVIQVITNEEKVGDGKITPIRRVMCHYDLEGNLLTQSKPFNYKELIAFLQEVETADNSESKEYFDELSDKAFRFKKMLAEEF